MRSDQTPVALLETEFIDISALFAAGDAVVFGKRLFKFSDLLSDIFESGKRFDNAQSVCLCAIFEDTIVVTNAPSRGSAGS